MRKRVSAMDEHDIEPIIAATETDAEGQFSIGPLNSSYEYDLALSRHGYKIVQVPTAAGDVPSNDDDGRVVAMADGADEEHERQQQQDKGQAMLQFSAYKLAELVVKVVDNSTGKDLSGWCCLTTVAIIIAIIIAMQVFCCRLSVTI